MNLGSIQGREFLEELRLLDSEGGICCMELQMRNVGEKRSCSVSRNAYCLFLKELGTVNVFELDITRITCPLCP
jgi:hypothetical protein